MNMNCSDFILFIWVFIMVITFMDKGDDGMDIYDRYTGISGEGKTRDHFGYIYKDGEFDIWSNLFDHNPFHNY